MLGVDPDTSLFGLVFEPLSDEVVVEVDVELAELACTGVGELVGDAGGGDQNLASAGVDRVIADNEGGIAFLQDEDFRVGMPVQPRTAPRRSIEEDEGGGHVAVQVPLQLVRVSQVRKVVAIDGCHRLSSSQRRQEALTG